MEWQTAVKKGGSGACLLFESKRHVRRGRKPRGCWLRPSGFVFRLVPGSRLLDNQTRRHELGFTSNTKEVVIAAGGFLAELVASSGNTRKGCSGGVKVAVVAFWCRGVRFANKTAAGGVRNRFWVAQGTGGWFVAVLVTQRRGRREVFGYVSFSQQQGRWGLVWLEAEKGSCSGFFLIVQGEDSGGGVWVVLCCARMNSRGHFGGCCGCCEPEKTKKEEGVRMVSLAGTHTCTLHRETELPGL